MQQSFLKSVVQIVTGKGGAAIVTILLTPIISRLFNPDDFGVAAVFVSLVTVIGGATALSYDRAIVLPKSEPWAGYIVRLSVLLTVGVGALLMVLVGLYAVGGYPLDYLEQMGPWLWLVPLAVIGFGLVHVFEAVLVRRQQYGYNAKLDIEQATLTGGGRVVCGYLWGSSVWGLLLSYIVALLWKTLRLALRSKDYLRRPSGLGHYRRYAITARTFSDFPIYNAPAAMLRSFAQELPLLLLASIFAPAVVGHYAMAKRLMFAPLNIFAHSIRRVYIQRSARRFNKGHSISREWLLVSGVLVASGLPIFVLVWLTGEPVLTWLLGERWASSGHFVELLAPWLFSLWVMPPTAGAYLVLRRQRTFLVVQVVLLVLRLGVFGVAVYLSLDPEQTIALFSYASALMNFANIMLAYTMLRAHDRVIGVAA